MRDTQLQQLDEDINKIFDGFKTSSRQELDLEEVRDKITEYTNALDNLKMEFRNLPPKEKGVYKSKAKQYATNLRTHKSKMDWEVVSNTRNQVLDGKNADGLKPATADGLMAQGLKTQEESQDSLARTLRTIEDTKTVGREVTVKLAAQTEQLTRMYDDLKDTQGTVARSTEILKRMARKSMTDKYVWGVVCLVGIAILGLILWKLADPDSSESIYVPDPVTKKHDLGRRLLGKLNR